MDWFLILTSLIKIIGILLLTIMPIVAYASLAERRVSAIIQDRLGPNRVGFGGVLQPIADGVKFMLKEDVTPGHVNKVYFWLAPVLVFLPAMLTAAVLPFGTNLDLSSIGLEGTMPLVISNIDAGPLFVFAIASLSVYGIVLAGWASNSKYPFLGGVRSTSQMISYEISLGLSIVPVLMIFGHLNLGEIVREQAHNGWTLLPLWGDSAPWNHAEPWSLASLKSWILLIPLGITFIIFMTSIFAETNRLPFDLPECETELVAGYHTEYSSMKFAMFMMGEYAAMVIGSGLAVTLFFGGWSLPGGWFSDEKVGLGGALSQFSTFFGKIVAFILFFIWVRWSIPRFRYDQLMKLGWVWFFEIALFNILLTAGLLIWLG